MGIISGIKIAAGGGVLIAGILFWSHYTGLKDTIAEKTGIIDDYKIQLAAAAEVNAQNQKQLAALGREMLAAEQLLEKARLRQMTRQKDTSDAHIKIEQIAARSDECPVARSVNFALDRLRGRGPAMPTSDVDKNGDPSGGRPGGDP